MDTVTLNRGIGSNIKVSDLPDEAFNEFSNAPFDFENTVCDLWDDTQRVYYHACTANRFSDNYLSFSNQLEKNIKQLGSFCLTKAALERKGISLSKLDSMTVHELICMVSFHYRKAHAALDGVYRDNNCLAMTYLNWEFRWIGLGSRLKATEVKIRKIREGSVNVDSMLEQTETFKGEPRTNADVSVPQSLHVNPNALPIKGSMAREMLCVEKEEERKADLIRKENERRHKLAVRYERELNRDLERSFMPARPFPMLKTDTSLSKREFAQILHEEAKTLSEPKAQAEKRSVPPGMLTEAEVRKKLLDDAVSRNDRDAIQLIPHESPDALGVRWEKYLERAVRKSGPSVSGPPPDVRKALRDKRKKKKK